MWPHGGTRSPHRGSMPLHMGHAAAWGQYVTAQGEGQLHRGFPCIEAFRALPFPLAR